MPLNERKKSIITYIIIASGRGDGAGGRTDL